MADYIIITSTTGHLLSELIEFNTTLLSIIESPTGLLIGVEHRIYGASKEKLTRDTIWYATR